MKIIILGLLLALVSLPMNAQEFNEYETPVYDEEIPSSEYVDLERQEEMMAQDLDNRDWSSEEEPIDVNDAE